MMRNALVVFMFFSAFCAHAEIGELEIPLVSPLEPAQLETLRDLASTHPEAEQLTEAVKQEALPLIGSEPDPLRVIHYEGLVNTDPRRIETVKHLHDMANASRLMKYWQTSADLRAAETLKTYILAWARTYELTGNDVNENKLYPLLVAYHALRNSFSAEERHEVDAWVETLGRLHYDAVKNSDHLTNRYAKHLRLSAITGRIMNEKDWIKAAYEGIKRFVSHSLYKDGSSLDLKRRDTLTYHGSALKPPLELAILAGEEGRALYEWTSERGGSLKKSVDYVVPYAMGEKTRKEWVNSKVGLDHRRAEAGLEHYRKGRLYKPKSALELMELASYFDPELMRVVRHLADSGAERFPTWQTLINEAARVDH